MLQDSAREEESSQTLEDKCLLKTKEFLYSVGEKNKQIICESIQMNETLWNAVQSQFTP